MPTPSIKQAERLIKQAQMGYLGAYCPYSDFPVGAAVLTIHGTMFHGCNVENASVGLSVCAERNAIAAAVAEGMRPGGLAAVALVTVEGLSVPCGACLQVIAEFAAHGCTIISTDLTGEVEYYSLDELLPQAFHM